ncbi:hypothetical protein [Clostridium bornimense]|nr:hypothetical protein [Clostridium bornimense]
MRKDLEFLLGEKIDSAKSLASTEACVSRIEEISKGIRNELS